jgi:hypothetical protein
VTEYAPVATVYVQSAGSVQTDGPYKVHAWTDHTQGGAAGTGHLSHLNFWVRQQHATWVSGVQLSFSGSGTGTVGMGNTSGNILQLHEHPFPAISDPADIYLVNDPTTPFLKITNLDDITQDSTGGSLTNRAYGLVIWAAVNEETGDCKFYANLPGGSYTSGQTDRVREDPEQYLDYSIPSEFKGVGFLVHRLVTVKTASTTTLHLGGTGDDIRGTIPGTSAGSTAVQATEFADSTFNIYNAADNSRIMNFDLSGMTGPHTVTMADQDISLVPDVDFQSYDATTVFTAAVQTLTNKTLTQPSLVLEQSAAPAPTASGEIWWDTATERIVVGQGAGAVRFLGLGADASYEPAFSKNTAFNKDFGGTGAAVTVARSDHIHSGVYEPVDPTILRDADIGVTVQGYDADTAFTDVANSFASTQTITGTVSNPLILARTGADKVTIKYQGSVASRYLGKDTSQNLTWGSSTDANLNDVVLLDVDIGSTVQAYDADTAKLDVAQTFTQTQKITGKLLVGTTTDAGADVHITQQAAAGEGLRISMDSSQAASQVEPKLTFALDESLTNPSAYISALEIDASDYRAHLTFGTNDVSSDTAATEKMRLTSGGQLELNDGSTSLPAYTFIDSPTTGIFSPGTNIWSVAIAGAESFRLTASGNGLFYNTLEVQDYVTINAAANALRLQSDGASSAPNITFTGDAAGTPIEVGSIDAVLTATSARMDYRVDQGNVRTTSDHRFYVDGTHICRINSGGFQLVAAGSLMGYTAGTGGAVEQITSRTTAVTLDESCGQITLVSAAGSASWQTFTVNNTVITQADTVILTQKSGTDLYETHVTNVQSGSFDITFRTTGGTTTEQPVFTFALINAVTS